MRVVKKLELTEDAKRRERLLKYAKREQSVLSNVFHLNIVRYYGLVTHRSSWWLFLELCTLGTLKAYLINNLSLPIENRVYIMRQCASALMYLHEMGVMHRDIKLGNILMTEEYGKHLVKISDFGMSILVCAENLDVDLTRHHIGTRYYRAPEQFEGEIYTSSVDIFALGLTFLVVFEFGLQNEFLVPRSCKLINISYMMCESIFDLI